MSDEYGGGPVEGSKEVETKDMSAGEKDKESKSGDDPELASLGENYRRDKETQELVYVDPQTKQEFVLNHDKTDWVPKGTAPAQASDKDYEFDGKTYLHTDSSGVKHKWDLDEKKWIVVKEDSSKAEKKGGNGEDEEEEEESEEDDETTDADRKARQFRKRKAAPGWGTQGEYLKDPDTGVQLYRDAKDGMLYEWDSAKNAWFPRIDEDFMAQYQMSYGFDNEGQSKPTMPDPEPDPAAQEEAAKKAKLEAEAAKSAKSKQKPTWFEDDSGKSTKVYITGLPLDMNEEKLGEFVSKCGVVDVDVRTNKPKLKLYRDANNQVKGDALCTYMKPESVELALQILDGSRLGETQNVVRVERAKFEMKGGAYDPKLKPKKLGKKELERRKKKQEKLLAWEPDKMRGERNKRDKVIVIENVFDPASFDVDPSKILECSGRLRQYCAKFGTVRRVVVYDKRADGVCQVFFNTPEEADTAISMLDGRLYGDSRVLKAFTWDGKTKYKVAETEEEERERLKKWDEFLAGDDDDQEAENKDKKDVKQATTTDVPSS